MISYYELLELIKEGKQPDRVDCFGILFHWNGTTYYSGSLTLRDYVENAYFSEIIEIIEDKPNEIEKLSFNTIENGDVLPIKRKVNELIDKVNYLLKEGKHEDIKK